MKPAQQFPNGDTAGKLSPLGAFSSFVSSSGNHPWSNPLLFAIIVGLASLIAYGWQKTERINVIAVALLIAGCALALGAILGFLFGIPRAVQESTPKAKVFNSFETAYQVNTNLEQISDWLTKIIIGVGLVEIRKIYEKFSVVAEYLSSSFGIANVPPSLIAVILLYFGSAGFLTFYLWTRIFLTLEFTRADRAARQSPEFYEGLIHALLYQPAPDGYESAIDAGEQYLKTYGEGNWRVWRSLACGYGQKFRYLSVRENPDKDEMNVARNRALNAVKRVLSLNPGERASLFSLWDRDHASPQEDDLTIFFDDPEFKAVLNPPAK